MEPLDSTGIGSNSSDGYQDVKVSSSVPTQKDNKRENDSGNVVSAFPAAFEALNQVIEKNLATSTLLISVIGYIVIATFGPLDPLRYFGYIFFLLFAFGLYRFIKRDKNSSYQLNKFLLATSVILLVVVIILLHKYITHYTYTLYKFLLDHKK